MAKNKPASGMYKNKARNLTDEQLKRANALKAANKRTQSVSDTSRAESGVNKGFTLGKGGKRFTGTVVMANGDRAVYKGGKRVTNTSKSSVKKNLSGTPRGGAGGGGTTNTGGGGTGGSSDTKKYNPPSKNKVLNYVRDAQRKSGSSAAGGISGKKTIGNGRVVAPNRKSGSSAAGGAGVKPTIRPSGTPLSNASTTPSPNSSAQVRFMIGKVKQQIAEKEKQIAGRAELARRAAARTTAASKNSAAEKKRIADAAAATKRDMAILKDLQNQLKSYQ